MKTGVTPGLLIILRRAAVILDLKEASWCATICTRLSMLTVEGNTVQ